MHKRITCVYVFIFLGGGGHATMALWDNIYVYKTPTRNICKQTTHNHSGVHPRRILLQLSKYKKQLLYIPEDS